MSNMIMAPYHGSPRQSNKCEKERQWRHACSLCCYDHGTSSRKLA